MKTRLTALLLCAALIAALGVNAATTDRFAAAAETPAAETEADAPAETAVTPDAAPAEAVEAEPAAGETLRFEEIRSRMLEHYYPLRALAENIKTLDEWDYKRTQGELADKLDETEEAQKAIQSGSSDELKALNAALDMAISMGDETSPITLALRASKAALSVSTATGSAFSEMMDQQLEMQYDAYLDAYEDLRTGKLQADNEGVKHQLRNLQDQAILAAESLFITCKGLAAQDAALSRTIASLERTEREMRLRGELGQVSALTLQQVQLGLLQAKSGQQTLRMNLDCVLLNLKAMCGFDLDAPLTLGALPQTTDAYLGAMNLEADLAKAQESSYELYEARKAYADAEDAYEDAKKEYGVNSKKNEWMQAKHTWQAAQYTSENAQQSFSLRFRTLYAQVRDAAQALDAKRAAVAVQEKVYAAEALRYERGMISANALADAKDALAQAKDEAESAARDLFAQYHTYENAVTYGILNS